MIDRAESRATNKEKKYRKDTKRGKKDDVRKRETTEARSRFRLCLDRRRRASLCVRAQDRYGEHAHIQRAPVGEGKSERREHESNERTRTRDLTMEQGALQRLELTGVAKVRTHSSLYTASPPVGTRTRDHTASLAAIPARQRKERKNSKRKDREERKWGRRKVWWFSSEPSPFVCLQFFVLSSLLRTLC